MPAAAAVAAALLHAAACGNIYTYDAVPLRPDVIQYRRVGMWAPQDAPAAGKPSTHSSSSAASSSPAPSSSSSVAMDLDFVRADARHAGVVQVLLFNAAQLHRLGTDIGASDRAYCCSPSVIAAHAKVAAGPSASGGGAKRPPSGTPASGTTIPGCSAASTGRLIVAPDATPPSSKSSSSAASSASAAHHHRAHGEEIVAHDVVFAANESHRSLTATVPITRSGIHYLVISSCEPRTGAIRFSGQTQWRNPYGFLPAELYSFLPFFGALTLAYAALAVGWAALCARHWSQLLPLQSAIACVLLLSVVEAATWYLAYRSFNESGARGLLPTIGGVVVSSSRRTISRLLVLTVCLGYGVVRPTLGSVAHRVALLGAIYFAATATLDVASNTSRLDEYAVPTRLLLVVPVGVLDAAYFWWCFSAMSRTLSQLARRRQSAKLLLYRRFSHVLMLLLLLSGVWVAWQMAFIVGDHLDERWRLLWTFDAFWHLLYAAMLLTICVLWSPSKSNLQYAYMDELAVHDNEEDADGADEEERRPSTEVG